MLLICRICFNLNENVCMTGQAVDVSNFLSPRMRVLSDTADDDDASPTLVLIPPSCPACCLLRTTFSPTFSREPAGHSLLISRSKSFHANERANRNRTIN